jgi:hypothetical protein
LTPPNPTFKINAQPKSGAPGERRASLDEESMDTGSIRASEGEALQFHAVGRPGKLSLAAARPLATRVALDTGLMRRLYPFCRLRGPANGAVQIVDMGATVSDLANLAARSAHDAIR